MLHISLLCSIIAAACSNQGKFLMDTPSRSIQHQKIPPYQNFYANCKDFSSKSPCAANFTIMQHNCSCMQQPRHIFEGHPLQINSASKNTPNPKFSCFLHKNNPPTFCILSYFAMFIPNDSSFKIVLINGVTS